MVYFVVFSCPLTAMFVSTKALPIVRAIPCLNTMNYSSTLYFSILIFLRKSTCIRLWRWKM